ncbi:hypothetical protein [Spirosoma sp.]|uniref:hypothetical protein n=1 Tax=Spirosoma sp. TaxID=1899569 RepID=UPI00262B363F|nr:hypothetical protein [Spirosoma sp.]MCX6213388.1 hypothetical protein [Spirosoma sp.]
MQIKINRVDYLKPTYPYIRFITDYNKPEKKLVSTKADDVRTMSYVDLGNQ